MTEHRPRHLLPVIIFSQFAGTSLWFAGNAVLPDLQKVLPAGALTPGWITILVQLGFIAGTLVFALMTLTDRYSPVRIFLACSLLGALANGALALLPPGPGSVTFFRLLTGFFLAGIYPVGMKIASDWYAEGLGKALGYLVGALVLGTAFPHLVRSLSDGLPWRQVLVCTSLFAAVGGVLLYLTVKDGPLRQKGQQFEYKAAFRLFRIPAFRSASFGYFGHMWELYTFWAFVPSLLRINRQYGENGGMDLSFLSFVVIGLGCIGCIAGGYLSRRIGSDRVAFYALLVSGCCCLLFLFLRKAPEAVFLPFLFIWGVTVVADSPQFSALVAKAAPAPYRGTALTLVTSIGFAITIVSIQVFGYLMETYNEPEVIFLFLAAGPVSGLLALFPLLKGETQTITQP